MKVRSWYGLPGEIEVENTLWHLVKIGDVPLGHPPLVNLILRRGLPRAERLRLSYLHEFGHFQTLPIALAHGLWIAWAGGRQRRSVMGWLSWLMAFAVAYEAIWELVAESYVMAADAVAYRATYRRTPNRLLPVFWLGMSGLAIGLSGWLLRGR